MHHAHPRTLSLSSSLSSNQIDNRSGRVRRVSVRETSGAADAVFQLFDGTDDSGQLLDTVSLSAGQSTRDYYRIGEYPYDGGLFLVVVSGVFEGAIVIQWRKPNEPECDVVLMVNPEVLQLEVPVG
jgi:hypothetical protein